MKLTMLELNICHNTSVTYISLHMSRMREKLQA